MTIVHDDYLRAFYIIIIQGMMCGYATNETKECMPMTIVLSHKLNKYETYSYSSMSYAIYYRKLAQFRRDGTFPWVRPDSKSQVHHSTEHSMCDCFIPTR